MPIVPSESKILVTGANGFVATWLVRTLLEKGYSVRGTVRSAAKGKSLSEQFASFGDKFEYAIVEDIVKEGAFDEAVKGVDAIEHTASPFYMDNVDDPEELIGPAVQGTVGVMKSAMKHGSLVKRIVITSSTASIFEMVPESKVFSEKDWNNLSVKNVKEQGKEASGADKYCASKTLAEKAAWDFKANNRVPWDVVALAPPYVFGPFIHEVSEPSALNLSTNLWYNTIVLGNCSDEQLMYNGICWIDVRDLALAHVLALEKPDAGGERFIMATGVSSWQDWFDTANSISPSPIPSHSIKKGNPGSSANTMPHIDYDMSKAPRILGFKGRSMQETIHDTLADFERRGW
ncbi:D-lactaldehyde dehydrogenase [Mycena floridula]|nr:D-lactaldehyde dehydrogenase [Mycena floridula]